MTKWFVCAALLAATLTVPGQAAPARAHVVKAIQRDGADVASADGVTVTFAAGKVEHAIRRDEAIPDGTRVDVPAGIVVVIESTGAKSSATLEPGASVTFISTGSGEFVASNGGKTIFSIVPKSLDFFRVQSGEAITAGVHGTIFSLDRSDGAVTVACTRGAVDIAKTGYLQIGAKTTKVSLIDAISPDGQPEATYHPTKDWYLARFATFAEAEAHFQAQVTAARQAGDSVTLSAALRNLGLIQWNQGKYTDALQTDQEALAIYQQKGDRDGAARLTDDIGLDQYGMAKYADALQTNQQALAVFRDLSDAADEARSLFRIGLAQERLGRYPEALQSDQDSLALEREVGDRDGEARDLNSIGALQVNTGHYDDAQQSLEQALAIYRELGDRDGEARALRNLGSVAYGQGRYTDDETLDDQAIAIYHALGDRDGEARSLTTKGNALIREGRYSAALEAEQKALALSRDTGDKDDEALALHAIGTAYFEQNRFAEGLETDQQAIALLHEAGDRDGEAQTIGNLGSIYFKQEKYYDALQYDLSRVGRSLRSSAHAALYRKRRVSAETVERSVAIVSRGARARSATRQSGRDRQRHRSHGPATGRAQASRLQWNDRVHAGSVAAAPADATLGEQRRSAGRRLRRRDAGRGALAAARVGLVGFRDP